MYLLFVLVFILWGTERIVACGFFYHKQFIHKNHNQAFAIEVCAIFNRCRMLLFSFCGLSVL